MVDSAPNETLQQYTRKIELQRRQETQQLTMAELYELRDLCANAVSHLTFNKVSIKDDK